MNRQVSNGRRYALNLVKTREKGATLSQTSSDSLRVDLELTTSWQDGASKLQVTDLLYGRAVFSASILAK